MTQRKTESTKNKWQATTETLRNERKFNCRVYESEKQNSLKDNTHTHTHTHTYARINLSPYYLGPWVKSQITSKTNTLL